jgi:hypothetical protein
MKTGIIGVLNNPATSLNSHSSGMVNIVKELFEADVLTENDNWSEYDRLIIYHGVNFRPGSFNVIGGLNEDNFLRAKKLSEFKGEIKSLDGFQLNSFSIKRKLNLYDDFVDFETIELPEKKSLVIGDSHSISVWKNKEYGISRNDGKTLFGFLKQDMDLSKYEKTTLYFGNIDVRFHLARQEDPIKATIELFTRYCEYAKKYNSTIVELLPIEDESRKIPKSGQYKKQNFCGSIELRKEIRNTANEVMAKSGLSMLTWPDWFVDNLGNLKFDVMEPKQSVHIRPKFYMMRHVKQLNLFEDGI